MNWLAVNTLFSTASVILMIALTVYAWSRQDEVKGGRFFTFLMLVEAIRVAGYTLEIVSPNVAMALSASKIQYIGVFAVLLWFMFTLNFAGYSARAIRVGMILAPFPAFILLLALTNELHGLIWYDVQISSSNAYTLFRAEYGVFFYVYFAFTLVLLVTGVIILTRASVRQWRLFRWQMFWWLLGTLAPAVGHYAIVLDWINPQLHPIPITYMVGAVFLTFAVYRLRLIEVMPIPFDAMFDNTPNPIIAYDLRRRVVAYNPAAAPFAVQRVDVIGTPITEVFPTLCRALGQDLNADEIHIGDADYQVIAAPALTRQGKTRGYLIILTDITPIRRAERAQHALLERISRLEALKSEMIRMGAHDLKNPLSTLIGYLDYFRMEGDALNAEAMSKPLEMMDRAAQMMLRIVTDILSLDRIERMAADQTFHSMNLAALVEQTAKALRTDADMKGLHYVVTGEEKKESDEQDESAFIVCGDAVQLREAISNLIGNAIKYTPQGGAVCISVKEEGGEIIFRVVDTGMGIPLDMQTKLFQPFFRAKTPENYQIEGTGLGLYLVKGIIERHSGAMIVESRYGEGSTFGFRLPASKTSDQVIG